MPEVVHSISWMRREELTGNLSRPVQELILPRKATLYYGDIAITFDTFQKFFEMSDIIREAIGPSQFKKLVSEEAWISATRVSAVRTQYGRGNHTELPELLWATQYHQAREPITKIHAVIGILNAEDQNHLWYCLGRAQSTTEKFIAVAIWILRKYNNLDIFSYASCRRWEVDRKPANRPSWLPNFGLEGRSIEPLIRGVFGPRGYKDLYNAGREDTATFSISEESSCLTVSGIWLGHVHALEDAFTGEESNLDLLEIFSRVTQSGPSIKQIPSQANLGVFWRILHLDQKDNRRFEDCDERLISFDPEDNEDGFPWFQKDDLFDLQYCKGRRLLISQEGYLCLGPAEAKAGDIITVMPGGKVPYLLRKSGENFELVGEWYLFPL